MTSLMSSTSSLPLEILFIQSSRAISTVRPASSKVRKTHPRATSLGGKRFASL